MTFVLLLLEHLPNLATPLNDAWFVFQKWDHVGERGGAENTLLAYIRGCFKAREGETNDRTKWELIRPESEIRAYLNTFLNDLK